MPGQPIRRAREALMKPPGNGSVLDPPGTRSLYAPPGATLDDDARARVEGLPSDAALWAIGKSVLLQLARTAELEKDRIAAARALLEYVQPAKPKGDGDDLNRLGSAELDRMAIEAVRVTGADQ